MKIRGSVFQFLLCALLLLSAGLPILWAMSVVVSEPRVFIASLWDERLFSLFARTLLYAGASSIGAVLIGLIPGIAMGRSNSRAARALWLIAPLPLLLPSMVMGYGWQELLVRMHVSPVPQSGLDVARCLFVLSTWLWPIPAGLLAFALRRVDASLLEQASMDGVLGRTLGRRMVLPGIVAAAICAVLAMQEFSIFEPTGISVMATELRMIFETGLLSSADNPIAALVGGVGNADAPDLPARAALALSAGLPVLLLTGVVCMLAMWIGRKIRWDETIEIVPPAPHVQASWAWTVAAWLIVLATIGLPIAAMVAALHRPFNPISVANELRPQLLSSLSIAGATGLTGILIACLSAIHRPRAMVALAIASFLIGGQFTAIALLRVLNGSDWGLWMLDENIAMVIAHAGRFAWIGLLAGASLHAGPWRAYREMANVDGASGSQTFFRVTVGLGWPVLALAGLLMGALSLTEVPATALLVPPSLVPMLLTWVHRQTYGPMLEASLVLCCIVLAMGWAAVLLWMLAKSRLRVSRRIVGPAVVLISLSIMGCEKSDQPEAVWGRAGRAPGDFVYPRAITRAPDGSFFVVDRAARVQHLDHDGKFLNGWTMHEWSRGKPVGLTVDQAGNLWVPDTHYNRVLVFTPDGREIRRFGVKGSGLGDFDLPTDVAFDRDGNIYISEYGDNNRIQVFDANLKPLREFGRLGSGDGELSRPQSIAIIDDLLYCTDAGNHRIAVFKLDGTFVKNLGGTGSAPGEYRFPYGLDVDRDGNLLVSEFGNNRVQKIDPKTGAGLATWGTPGKLPGEFTYAWAVAADGDRAIVVDAGNNRLQVIRFH